MTQQMTIACIPDIEEARRALDEAIAEQRSLAVITHRYMLYVVACVRTKRHAAEALGLDRRTIQRWMKEPERARLRSGPLKKRFQNRDHQKPEGTS